MKMSEFFTVIGDLQDDVENQVITLEKAKESLAEAYERLETKPLPLETYFALLIPVDDSAGSEESSHEYSTSYEESSYSSY